MSDNIDDLFEDDDLGDAEDLLDEVPEIDATPWDPEPGDGVAGRVEERYDVPDEYDEDGVETVPCVTIVDKDDERWSIRGYRTVLRKEMRRADPQEGDLFAVKYLGPREITKGKFKGKDTHVYRAKTRKAAVAS